MVRRTVHTVPTDRAPPVAPPGGVRVGTEVDRRQVSWLAHCGRPSGRPRTLPAFPAASENAG